MSVRAGTVESLGEEIRMPTRTLSILAAAAVAGSLWAAPASVSIPSFWRYAHPEAKALVGVEWSRIAESPLGRQLRQKISESGGPVEGLDLLDGVERVFVSSPGRQGRAEGEQPPAVLAIQGRFDLDRVRAAVAEKLSGSSRHRSIEILEGVKEGEDTTALALVDDRTLLAGDVESVRAAIDNYTGGSAPQGSSPLYARAAELAAANDIWVIGYASPEDFAGPGLEQAPFLNDIDSLEAGVTLSDGLAVRLNLGARSDQKAAEMAAGLQLLLGMAIASRKDQMGGVNWSEKLQVAAERSLVKMSFSLSPQEFEQGIQSFTSSVTAAAGAEAGDVPVRGKIGAGSVWSWGEGGAAPPARREAPSGRTTIRIHGLEGGTREVLLGSR
jgi:hypothetical protein